MPTIHHAIATKAANFVAMPPLRIADITMIINTIKLAGPEGLPSRRLRDMSRELRRALACDSLPSELIDAGVIRKRVGNATRYYIPDFM